MTPSEEFTPTETGGPDYTTADCGEVSGATAAAEAFVAPTDTTVTVRSMTGADRAVTLTLEVGSQEHARLTLRMDLSPDDAADLARRIVACADAVGGDNVAGGEEP